MKKIVYAVLLCLVFVLAQSSGAFAWWWSSEEDDTPYVTSADTAERAAEILIRDVWGSKSRRAGETESITRVKAIRSIPQADGTLALDMRIHIEGSTEYGVWDNVLRNAKELFPKFLKDKNLAGINDFRLYGSLPMRDKGSGYVSEDNVSKLFLTRDSIGKIDWEKTDTTDLHFLLIKMDDGKNCTYWLHGGILSKVSHLKYFAK